MLPALVWTADIITHPHLYDTEEIENWSWDKVTKEKANGQASSIRRFENLVSFIVQKNSLHPMKGIAAFPNIRVLIEIGCIFPVTSAEAERSFSVLRRLKTCTRNSMKEDHLASLSLMHMNYDIPIDENEIVERFVRKNPHRLFRSLYIE